MIEDKRMSGHKDSGVRSTQPSRTGALFESTALLMTMLIGWMRFRRYWRARPVLSPSTRLPAATLRLLRRSRVMKPPLVHQGVACRRPMRLVGQQRQLKAVPAGSIYMRPEYNAHTLNVIDNTIHGQQCRPAWFLQRPGLLNGCPTGADRLGRGVESHTCGAKQLVQTMFFE